MSFSFGSASPPDHDAPLAVPRWMERLKESDRKEDVVRVLVEISSAIKRGLSLDVVVSLLELVLFHGNEGQSSEVCEAALIVVQNILVCFEESLSPADLAKIFYLVEKSVRKGASTSFECILSCNRFCDSAESLMEAVVASGGKVDSGKSLEAVVKLLGSCDMRKLSKVWFSFVVERACCRNVELAAVRSVVEVFHKLWGFQHPGVHCTFRLPAQELQELQRVVENCAYLHWKLSTQLDFLHKVVLLSGMHFVEVCSGMQDDSLQDRSSGIGQRKDVSILGRAIFHENKKLWASAWELWFLLLDLVLAYRLHSSLDVMQLVASRVMDGCSCDRDFAMGWKKWELFVKGVLASGFVKPSVVGFLFSATAAFLEDIVEDDVLCNTWGLLGDIVARGSANIVPDFFACVRKSLCWLENEKLEKVILRCCSVMFTTISHLPFQDQSVALRTKTLLKEWIVGSGGPLAALVQCSSEKTSEVWIELLLKFVARTATALGPRVLCNPAICLEERGSNVLWTVVLAAQVCKCFPFMKSDSLVEAGLRCTAALLDQSLRARDVVEDKEERATLFVHNFEKLYAVMRSVARKEEFSGAVCNSLCDLWVCVTERILRLARLEKKEALVLSGFCLALPLDFFSQAMKESMIKEGDQESGEENSMVEGVYRGSAKLGAVWKDLFGVVDWDTGFLSCVRTNFERVCGLVDEEVCDICVVDAYATFISSPVIPQVAKHSKRAAMELASGVIDVVARYLLPSYFFQAFEDMMIWIVVTVDGLEGRKDVVDVLAGLCHGLESWLSDPLIGGNARRKEEAAKNMLVNVVDTLLAKITSQKGYDSEMLREIEDWFVLVIRSTSKALKEKGVAFWEKTYGLMAPGVFEYPSEFFANQMISLQDIMGSDRLHLPGIESLEESFMEQSQSMEDKGFDRWKEDPLSLEARALSSQGEESNLKRRKFEDEESLRSLEKSQKSLKEYLREFQELGEQEGEIIPSEETRPSADIVFSMLQEKQFVEGVFSADRSSKVLWGIMKNVMECLEGVAEKKRRK